MRGITVKGLAGLDAPTSTSTPSRCKGAKPTARVEIEVQTKGGPIKRQVKRVEPGANLHDLSGGIEAYKGLFVTDIDAIDDTIELSNGDVVVAGQLADATSPRRPSGASRSARSSAPTSTRSASSSARASRCCRCSSSTRSRSTATTSREDTLGDYARVFEEEYEALVEEVLGELDLDEATAAYQEYLSRDQRPGRPEGYFSIDRKTRHQVDRDDRTRRRREGPVQGRRRLRPDPQGQGAAALVRRAGALHLLPLGAARGMGQPQRLRHGHAQEERQHRLPPPGDRSRPASGRGPARRAHGQPRHRPRHQRADGGHRRVVHRLRHRAPEGDRRVARRPARARRARVLHGQDRSRRADGPSQRRARRSPRRSTTSSSRTTTSTTTALVTELHGRPKAAGTLAEPTSEVLKPVIDYCWPLDRLALPRPPEADGRPQAQEDPAQRGELRQEGVPGALGPDQPQGRLSGRVRLRRTHQQVRRALDKHLKVARIQYVVQPASSGRRSRPTTSRAARGSRSPARRPTPRPSPRGSQVPYDLLGEITEKTQLTRRTAAAILARRQARRPSRSSGRTPSSSSPRPPGSSTSRRPR